MAKKYTLTEMKKANKEAGEFFFQPGNRKYFGPHKAVYNKSILTNYIVVKQGDKVIWYKFDARTGKINWINPNTHVAPMFRTLTEHRVLNGRIR